jgi:hypothetical protein
LAHNQAILLTMSAGKPQEPPIVDMNSIIITKSMPSTLEDELINSTDLLEPLLL